MNKLITAVAVSLLALSIGCGPDEGGYAIGDTGPAGGIVFYVDGTGQSGLEAAPTDLDDGGTGAEWGCRGTDIPGADSTAIGTGAQNTADMLAAACAPYYAWKTLAVDLVSAYSLNGFDDWFLPSQGELNALFAANAVVGGFATSDYWSSSESGVDLAVYRYFYHPSYSDIVSKSYALGVRAIRAFGPPPTYAIGDTGPAGGIVFYATPFTDSYGIERNGLEAAPIQTGDWLAEWGCLGTDITGADGTAIGTGAQNTADMLAAECAPDEEYGPFPLAADLVSAYSLNGFNDWFLPSIDEIDAMYAQKDIVGWGGE